MHLCDYAMPFGVVHRVWIFGIFSDEEKHLDGSHMEVGGDADGDADIKNNTKDHKRWVSLRSVKLQTIFYSNKSKSFVYPIRMR